MTVVWQWIAFSIKGVARPIYHAIKPARGAVHEPRWDRACGNEGSGTEIDPDGREWCLGCRRRVLGVSI